jgi:hypothetical protein
MSASNQGATNRHKVVSEMRGDGCRLCPQVIAAKTVGEWLGESVAILGYDLLIINDYQRFKIGWCGS